MTRKVVLLCIGDVPSEVEAAIFLLGLSRRFCASNYFLVSNKNFFLAMEVTKHNFEVIFPKFVDLLASCEFYTIDLEMTGINLKKPVAEHADPKTCPLNAPVGEVIFPNKDAAARHYTIVQLGIALFHQIDPDEKPSRPWGGGAAGGDNTPVPKPVVFDDDDDDGAASPGPDVPTATESQLGAYKVRSFNFYLFPSIETDRDVTMSAETVAGFLTNHGMDFNKWISNGIGYVTAEEAAAIRAKRLGDSSMEELEDYAKTDTQFANFMLQVKKLALDRTSNTTIDFPYFASQVVLQRATKLLQLLGLKKTSVEQGGKKRYKVSVIHGMDPSNEEADSRERSLGAYKLWEQLLYYKKPMIAHNCLSDVLFLYNAFNSTPLKNYEDFKKIFHRMFPVVFDTRCLVTLPEIGHDAEIVHNLEGQYKFFCERHKSKCPAIKFDLGFEHFHPAILSSPLGAHAAHDAAYDAYMTGCLFLALQHRLGGAERVYNTYANQLAVYGSIVTCNLVGKDTVIANAPILLISFSDKSVGPRSLDQALRGTDLQGRVMMTTNAAVIFCSQPMSKQEVSSRLPKAQAQVQKACEGAVVTLLHLPQ